MRELTQEEVEKLEIMKNSMNPITLSQKIWWWLRNGEEDRRIILGAIECFVTNTKEEMEKELDDNQGESE